MKNNLNSYKNKNIIITGGASFIGSHLTELMLEAGANITVIDDLSSGKIEHLNQIEKDINFIAGDVRTWG